MNKNEENINKLLNVIERKTDIDKRDYAMLIILIKLVLRFRDIICPKFIPTTIIGLDLGIKDLVVTSNYQKYKN